MPAVASLSRLWVLLALVAVIAYASCAAGAMPCSVAKPIGLAASFLAAGFIVLAPERPSEASDPVEEAGVER